MTHKSENKIIDPARQKAVRLGPEERVRQAMVSYLHEQLRIPMGLIAVEQGVAGVDKMGRADIVVYKRDGSPWMVIECKAPDIAIRQAAFDQISSYQRTLRAPYAMVSNGQEHYCCEYHYAEDRMAFLDGLPSYPEEKSPVRE